LIRALSAALHLSRLPSARTGAGQRSTRVVQLE
jgi:hypothetical protein